MNVFATITVAAATAAIGTWISWVSAGGRRGRVLDVISRELQIIAQLDLQHPHRNALQQRVDEHLGAYVAPPAAINERWVRWLATALAFVLGLTLAVIASASLEAGFTDQLLIGGASGVIVAPLASVLTRGVHWRRRNRMPLPATT